MYKKLIYKDIARALKAKGKIIQIIKQRNSIVRICMRSCQGGGLMQDSKGSFMSNYIVNHL